MPVDRSGNFVAEEVLPSGLHTVEVAVLDEGGNGSLYLRDLEFERNDWFYVGLADLTVSEIAQSGPADLLQGENAPYDYDSNFDGRLAFYVNGKLNEHWGHDRERRHARRTGGGSVQQLPGQVARLAVPSHRSGLPLSDVRRRCHRRGSRADARQVLRQGESQTRTTRCGATSRSIISATSSRMSIAACTAATCTINPKRRRASASNASSIDGFAAEPGTLASREEFRGTGGSLYFLRNQDILVGSERVRIELRDKDSGLVTGVKNLQPVLDYDIDYLQGRVLLTEPLGLDGGRRSAHSQRRL